MKAKVKSGFEEHADKTLEELQEMARLYNEKANNDQLRTSGNTETQK